MVMAAVGVVSSIIGTFFVRSKEEASQVFKQNEEADGKE
jgi:Na+/H+-translocating membrane pyrophosphatase